MLLFGFPEGGSGEGFNSLMRDPKGYLIGGLPRGLFCLKVHAQSGICERCLYSGLGNHPFCPGIPRFLEENGLRVQQFTLKVIVVTYKTFKLIVGFFETLSKNAQKPRKIKEK